MGNFFGSLFAVDMGIQFVGWAVATTFRTEKFFDLTGSLTFLLVSYLSYLKSRQTLRQFVQSHMVLAWASRLGLYLFTRIMKDGRDKRFDEIRENPTKFFVVWTLQGLWVFITLLPTLMLNASNREVSLGNRDILGWTLWAVGMFFEVVADYQKSAFRNDPANKGKFITSGLWSISRHPNYFGEILLWFGLYLSASSVFRGYEYASILSPVFVHLLITRVSGVPGLEEAGLKKWGHLPEYQQYLKETPSLIPFTNWF